MCLRILKHYQAILIVNVGQGKCIPVKPVKKLLLCFQVSAESLVKVQVIMRQVTEYAACKA